MRNKIKNVAFFSEDLKQSYEQLKEGKFEDKKLHQFVSRAIDDLKQNPFCGIRITKRLIPKEMAHKFQIDNLWKYNLPNAWGLFYTVVGDEIKIVAVILDWMSHKDYERLFRF